MKFVTLVLLSLLTLSCTNATSSIGASRDENKVKAVVSQNTTATPSSNKKITEAITLAKQNKDYRLLATSGRSTSIPGVDMRDFQTLIKLCGKKYNPEAGDVITSAEQRGERKKQLDFMRQYNEQMLVICRDNLAK